MNRLLVVSVTLCSMLASSQPVAKATPLLPFKATEKTLPNGLKIIVVPTGFPNLVSTQISVQTGSRNEVEPGKSGFAHFFEHMMFRGTKKYSADQYSAVLTRAGARSNAYTSDDFTNYHTTFAKEDLDKVLEIEGDRFQNLAYDLEGFKTESRAVLGEYNKSSANPMLKLFEVQREHAFTTHTYKHTTIGFLKDIEDMPNQFEYSRQFFDRWYRPEYTTVIVAGDVVPDAVIAQVTKYFGGWKRGSYTVTIPSEPPATAPVYAHVPWPTATLPLVTVAFQCPAFSEKEKDHAALGLLFDLLFGETSDLHKRLVDQEQVVDTLEPELDNSVDPSLCTVLARVKKPADAVRIRDALLQTIAQARLELVDSQRLADARANSKNSLLRSLDTTASIAGTLARYGHFHRSFDTLNQAFAVKASLTPPDLLAAAKKYLTDANLVVTTLSKEALPEGIATAPSLASFAAKPAERALALVQQRTELPLINLKLSFAAGSAADPVGKEGLALLTAHMISEAGSKRLPIDQVNLALYPLAGSFTSSVDKEVTRFTGITGAADWDTFVSIALPQLLEPGFRTEDFERLKAQQLNRLMNDLRSNNEEELGRVRLATTLFAGTPYAHDPLGTVAGLKAITLDDVKAFAAAHYTQANLTVGLAGHFADTAPARLQRSLAQLPAGSTVETSAVPAAHKPKGLEVELIKKETRATAISLGFPIDVTRAHPDFAALSIARTWLGEHRSSMARLFQRIREVRGMNYGDYAYLEAFPAAGSAFFPRGGAPRRAQLFEIWIRPVAPENAHFALRIALHELTALATNGLSQADFEATREYLLKNVYLLTSTQDQQLGYALDQRFYGLGDYATTMREALSKLTLDDVNRAIRTHLSTKNVSVVMVVKDAEGLKAKLLADAFSPMTYEATKPAELLDEDKRIGAEKLNLAADAVTITPVDAVFAK